MKVAACQLPYVRRDVDHALSLVAAYTFEAQRDGAALVCFSECFLQGYEVTSDHIYETAIELSSPRFARVLRELKRLEPIIVVGMIERDGDKFHNTALVIERGTLLMRYRKIHLLRGEASIFEPGNDCPVFDLQGVTVGVNICSDTNHAQSVKAVARAGAKLLACPCNNMMRRSTAEEWKLRHNEIRAERAREANLWLVSSDVAGEVDDRISYGPTAIIDPTGCVVDQVPLMKTGMVSAEIAFG